MIAFEGMRHIALKVADVERAARFYEKAFGMRRFAGKRGATYLRHHDIAKGVPSVFFRDPDGYTFQIIRFPRFTRAYIAMLLALNWLRR